MHVLPLVLLLVGAAPALEPGDQSRSVKVDGLERTYLLHVPPHYDAKRPTPVVLAFHGAFTDSRIMALLSGLSSKADKAGFVVVYPDGSGKGPVRFFNPGDRAAGGLPNDVRFVGKLLDDVEKVINVDRKRVYATGLSNGGMLCYRLAAELSDRIAAIAPVAGTMTFVDCQPSRPVSVIHFHGTLDDLVPIDGKRSSAQVLKFRPIEEVVREWARIDGCPATPKIDVLPDRVDDGTRVTRTTYGPGKQASEVILYTIAGGGHTWPSRNPGVHFLGKSTRDISANDLIWDFFQRHPMK